MSDLARQVRLLLEDSPEAPSLSQVVDSVQYAVAEWSSSPSPQPQIVLSSLEDIYHRVVDHTIFRQVDTLLTILYHLRPVIPTTSIISTWFDLVLRPALREPKLPTSGVTYAKELIITALERPEGDDAEKLKNFRRRLLDLYLLDAYNESSGHDALEWAELDQDQRDSKAHWKANLQDVLVMFGLKRPKDLMSEMFHCFATPSSRLQLLILLNSYVSQTSFPPLASTLAGHPLFNSLIISLEVDNSSTACAVGLNILTKLLPILAAHVPSVLKNNLPQFLTILARIICWKARQPSILPSIDPDAIEDLGEAEKPVKDRDNPGRLEISPHLEWQRLELTFDATVSLAPPAGCYFTHLYFLFPRNVIEFLRQPVEYLSRAAAEWPYAAGWASILDEEQIRENSKILFQGHVIHPSFLSTKDAAAELEEPLFCSQYDLPRIVGECAMMDAHNVVIGLRGKTPGPVLNLPTELPLEPLPRSPTSDFSHSAGTIHRVGRHRVSVQDIITTSVALKSGLEIDIERDDPSLTWPNVLFSSSSANSPTKRCVSLPSEGGSVKSHSERDWELPSHVVEAVSRLQRQLLLLRNELNLELWLARNNMQHIARLNQERVLAQNAEGERQGLHNKLREYKSDVVRLQKELKIHKEQASSVKNKYADWNAELQQKLREFREQKRTWTLEVAELRAADLQHKAIFEAQGKLLASATNRVFELETTIKETAYKVERLRDYEKQIEQLIKMQRLWEDDTQKLNEQTEQMRIMTSKYEGMKLLLQSYQEGRGELETEARQNREKVRTLEAHLSLTKQQLAAASHKKTQALSKASEATSSNLVKTNQRLRDENTDLRDEIEELREMVEILKTREKPGLVSDPTSSPRMIPVFR